MPAGNWNRAWRYFRKLWRLIVSRRYISTIVNGSPSSRIIIEEFDARIKYKSINLQSLKEDLANYGFILFFALSCSICEFHIVSYLRRTTRNPLMVLLEIQESPNPAGAHSQTILDTWIPGHHRPAIYLVPTKLSQLYGASYALGAIALGAAALAVTLGPWKESTRSPFQRVRHTKILEMSSAQHFPLRVHTVVKLHCDSDIYVNASAIVLGDADVELDSSFTTAFYNRRNNLACI